jgi:mono/diheme cytochrome c family protein
MNAITIRRFGALTVAFCAAMLIAPASRAQDGAKIFADKKCASCHGVDGHANVPAGKALKTRDFSLPDVMAESDSDLATVIAKGKNKMPAYEKQLKDAEIKSLVTYLRSLGKK